VTSRPSKRVGTLASFFVVDRHQVFVLVEKIDDFFVACPCVIKSSLDRSRAALQTNRIALQQDRCTPPGCAPRNSMGITIMSKTKTTDHETHGTAETIEAALTNGTQALKTTFDKAVKGYDQMLGFSKDTLDAYVKSANVAGKGAETLRNEIQAYSKHSIEETVAAAKAVMAAKSAHEAFELQTEFAKAAFEGYVGQMKKMSELFASTSKETLAPIQGRVQAWVDVVQKARAA
jgi:phasin family protein